MSPLPESFERYIQEAQRRIGEAVETGIREVMEADGLTEDMLKQRASIHQREGRIALLVDGRIRREWFLSEFKP